MLTEMDLTVPTEIGMLTNLEIFAIESNKLLDEGVSIPSEIGNLNRLRKFVASAIISIYIYIYIYDIYAKNYLLHHLLHRCHVPQAPLLCKGKLLKVPYQQK